MNRVLVRPTVTYKKRNSKYPLYWKVMWAMLEYTRAGALRLKYRKLLIPIGNNRRGQHLTSPA